MQAILDIWFHTKWDEVMIGTAAVLTAGEVIRRLAIRPMIKRVREFSNFVHLAHHELVENSGKSLKDAVIRMEEMVTGLAEQHSQLRDLGEGVLDRLSRIERDLYETPPRGIPQVGSNP